MNIIVLCYPHTGSTALHNIIHGLYDTPGTPVVISNTITDSLVMKSHFMGLLSETKKGTDAWFILAQRDRKYDNLNHRCIVIPYDVICNGTEAEIVNNIARMTQRIPLPQNIPVAIERFAGMNRFYPLIKDRPFTYSDDYYSLHGHHRNRNFCV